MCVLDYDYIMKEDIVSHFAQHVNLPICRYLDSIQANPKNTQKEPITFLSGDPTLYGELNFKMPQKGYDILKDAILNDNNHGYTNSTGVPKAKEAIAKLYKCDFLKPANIFINHGVNMGLLSLLLTMSNQGQQVLVPQIGYPFYTDLCPSLHRIAVPYRLLPQKDFQIDIPHLQSLITQKTAFIYVVNPSNPIGSVFSRKHMQEILNLSDRHEIPLVVDEVYFKQSFPGVEFTSFGDLTIDTPVIVLCGVQKILSVPGWSTAWIAIFDKHNYLQTIVKNIAVSSMIFLHSNVFTMQALPKILEEVGVFTANHMDKIAANHQYISGRINKIQGLKAVKAYGTIYMTVVIDIQQFSQVENDKEFAKLLLAEENVNVLPISILGGNLQGFRLLTCTKQQYYDEFFKRLEEFISKHRK